MNWKGFLLNKLWVFFLIGIGFLVYRCNEVSTENISNENVGLNPVDLVVDSSEKESIFMELIEHYPKIPDTVNFINHLVESFQLEIEFLDIDTKNHRITNYQKVDLKGATDAVFLIEYSFPNGATALFPWKYQCLVTENGEPMGVLQAKRFECLQINANEKPYLLTLTVTGRGNGGHQIYRVQNDTLNNVLSGFRDYFPRTFDSHGETVNDPNELELSVIDANHDGLNDIAFTGFIENPIERIPVNFIFIYDPKTEHFIEHENYAKKYLHLDSLSF